MNASTLSSIVALGLPIGLLMVLAVALAAGFRRSRRRAEPAPLPSAWRLTPRLVFSNDECQVYRLLREALPHQVLLPKLALVRLCQPVDPAERRHWYDSLGSTHVSFAICSPSGRVVAAIDIDSGHPTSRRTLQIKQAVLAACQVHYLRCAAHDLPSAAELQLLVPAVAGAARALQSAESAALNQARQALAGTVGARRAERTVLWHDSTIFQDSFFAPDTRPDAFAPSRSAAAPAPGDGGGEVVDPQAPVPAPQR